MPHFQRQGGNAATFKKQNVAERNFIHFRFLLKNHKTSFMQRVALRRLAHACQLHSRFVLWVEESEWRGRYEQSL